MHSGVHAAAPEGVGVGVADGAAVEALGGEGECFEVPDGSGADTRIWALGQ